MAILVPALVVMIAAGIAIKRMPNIYESSTFIVVESPKSETASGDVSVELSQRLATIKQQVTSRSRLESVVNKFGLYKKELEKGQRLDDLISDMRAQVGVEVPPNPENVTKAFSISFRDQNPEIAQKVTAELAEHLIKDNVEAIQKNVSGEVQVLDQRAEELSAQLHELEVSHPWLLTLREDMPIIPVFATGGGASNAASVAKANADAARSHNMSVEGLKDQQEKLQKQLAEVEKSIAELKPVVDQQKKGSALPGNAAYGTLIARRAELIGQRDDMIKNQGYTDRHPKVLNINEQIAAIDRQIDDLKRQSAGSMSQTPEAIQLRQLEGQRNQLKIDLEVAEKAVARQLANPPKPMAATTAGNPSSVPETPATKDPGAARIAQDYLGMKNDYKQVLAKKQEVELREKTLGSSKVDQYRVIDQASVPQLPVAPNRKVLMLIAATLGLTIGIVFAGLLEYRRFASLQDVKDVEFYAKLPMLAAIPKILTIEERKMEARQHRRKLLFGAVAAGLAIFILTGVFMFTNLFGLLIRK
jgi:uncharacterized protein involved in exopolysaccharide biosynthesis